MKTSMLKSALVAAGLGLVSLSVFAQAGPCAGGTRITGTGALVAKLAGKTVPD